MAAEKHCSGWMGHGVRPSCVVVSLSLNMPLMDCYILMLRSRGLNVAKTGPSKVHGSSIRNILFGNETVQYVSILGK